MTTSLNGQQRLGSHLSAESSTTFTGQNPATGESLPTQFHEASEAEIDSALELAAAAYTTFRSTSPEQRAAFLEAIADEVEALGDPLLELPGFKIGKNGIERVFDLNLRGKAGNTQVEVMRYFMNV